MVCDRDIFKTSYFKIWKLCQDENFLIKESNQQISPQVVFFGMVR